MVSIRHSVEAVGSNDPTEQVSVNAWNDEHEVTGTPDKFLGFDGNGDLAELDIPVGDSGIPAVSTMVALTALTDPATKKAVALTEAGREGIFVFSSTNLSAKVTIDSTKGIYAAPDSDPTGTTGAWVRQFEGPIMVDWFLVAPGIFTTKAIVQKIEDLRTAGSSVQFGAGTYNIGNVVLNKNGHWKGVGKNTVIAHAGSDVEHTFVNNNNNGTRFSHMRFTGLSTPNNSGAPFPLLVRVYAGMVEADMKDFEFDHLWFDGCDTGIRVIYTPIGPVNDIPGTTWYSTERVHIHDCVFDDVLYEAIVPQGRDVVIERCRFKLSAKPPGGYRPFSYFLRVIGCDRVTIRDNYFECPYDYPTIAIAMGGVDNGLTNTAYRMASNVTIMNNRWNGGYVHISESSNMLLIKNNNFWNNPQSTTDFPISLFQIGNSGIPVFFSKIFIEDNYAVGYPKSIFFENVASHQVSIKRNTFIGNKKTGGFADISPLSFQINVGAKLVDGVTNIPAPVLLEIEDNNLFYNPTPTGFACNFVGDFTGMHFRYAGNKISERPYGVNQLFAPGTGDPKIAVSKDTAFVAWSTLATSLSADVVGDNVAMPSGFYAALMNSTFFRPEQTVGAFPPVFP